MNLSSFGEEGGEKRKRHAFLSEGPRDQSVSKQLLAGRRGLQRKSGEAQGVRECMLRLLAS